MSQSLWNDADVISTYSRAQAIEDGVLVDLMQADTVALVREAGFKLPVAMTVAAWHETVMPPDGKLPACQDLKGRLSDVLWMLRSALVRARRDTDRVHFKLRVWDGRGHNVVRLWSLCGPDDNAEPVITIMLEGED